jgi:acyl-coenzyme A synthetase/AMP-(fatty) acid ligase
MPGADYDSLYQSFRWQTPDQFNFARDVVDHWAEQRPDKLALWWVDDDGNEETRSFAQISEASKQLAGALRELGVRQRDRVVVMLSRQLAWWEIFTACLRMGAVISPATIQLSDKDIAYRVNAAEATCFITDADNAEKFDRVAGQCTSVRTRIVIDADRDGWQHYAALLECAQPFDGEATSADDEALCYFTSGTTGYPKMCIHRQGYALGHETTGRYWLDLSSEDLHWNLSDTGWAKAAWSSYFAPWLCGAALFVHHSTGFDAERTLELLRNYPVTTFCGAPTIYRMLIQLSLSGLKSRPLRHCVSAGEPLNPEVIQQWREHSGLTICDGYGQTETTQLCASFPGIETRAGSMGKPSPGIKLAVIDDNGAVLPDHTEGDLAVDLSTGRPPGLYLGYHGQPEKTAATFRGQWYITGDRAYRDEDGYFWFVSRADDVILSSGYRIGPFEVESALLEHPDVIESAVVASPDAERGEVVKAFIVLADNIEASDALAADIQAHVKTTTAPYKYPRKIEFVDSLPKTVSGKIRRVELREQEWAER